jgi:type III secretion protein Q
LRAVRRWVAPYLRLGEVERVLADLVRATVRVSLRRVETLAEARPFAPGYGVRLQVDDASGAEVLLLVESALAISVVARALDRTPPVFSRDAEESPALAGAFGAVVATAARRVSSTEAFRVAATGSASELAARLPGAAMDWGVIGLTVMVGDDAHVARLVVSTRVALAAPEPRWNRARLRSLGATPLSLPLVATTFEARATDVASLEPGDALVTPKWPLTAGTQGGWAGPLWLAAPSGAIGMACVVSDDGRLVLRGETEALWIREAEMVESEESSALVAAVGDVPVVVRVEIGEARMAAREWADLERGDVIALGRKIGERVILRIGGVPVATGELVQVDGDVGVRVVERLNLGETSV